MNNKNLIFHSDFNITPKQTVRVLGIDLGTTNSVAAEVIYEPGELGIPEAGCINYEQVTTGGPYYDGLVPSVVVLNKAKVFIGEGAKRFRAKSSQAGLQQNVNLFFECKNDVGLKKTYHKAPEGYRNAREISSHILDFMLKGAMQDNEQTPDRVVVTVPASFQAAQRKDTLEAARLAGIDIQDGDLLDEPVAAFLDFVISNKDKIDIEKHTQKNLLVFDFGGGTCDVAIFKLSFKEEKASLGVSSLSVSRYHRLGGGDIDAAIVHEVLIPQLIEQNDIDPFELTYEIKKKILEPTYLGIAESLKIGLCKEITRLKKFGNYKTKNKNEIVQINPGVISCFLKGGRELRLKNATLTADQFLEILEPFLDTDLLIPKESEYRFTCSIFAPLQDALDRAGLDNSDIDFCLLVGGSCFIPKINEEIQDRFKGSQILMYPDYDSLQLAVARGATYHALSLALYGKGIVSPVCHGGIDFIVKGGSFELVPCGARLPYPTNGLKEFKGLQVPNGSLLESVDVLVKLQTHNDEDLLYQQTWSVPAPVSADEKLLLKYRMDSNQCLSLEMSLENAPEKTFADFIENPLTHVQNPSAIRLKIEELEEDIKTGKIPKEDLSETFYELAKKYRELGQREKALDYLKVALKAKGRPDCNILNLMGITAAELRDGRRAEKFYREASEANPVWGGALFNLSLVYEEERRFQEALEVLDEALERENDPPYLVSKALILLKLGEKERAHEITNKAIDDFSPIEILNDWELHCVKRHQKLTP